MAYLPMDDVDKVTANRYEAVIVAAKHARFLNSQRLARLERQLEDDESVQVEARKVTMVALKDLVEGKVKYQRSDTD